MQDILTGCDGWTAAGEERGGGESQLRAERLALPRLLGYYRSTSGCVCVSAEDVKSARSGGSVKII